MSAVRSTTVTGSTEHAAGQAGILSENRRGNRGTNDTFMMGKGLETGRGAKEFSQPEAHLQVAF